VTLIAGYRWQRLLMVVDDDEMSVARSLDVTPQTTEQRLIVRSDKSVAYVTNVTRAQWRKWHWTQGTRLLNLQLSRSSVSTPQIL